MKSIKFLALTGIILLSIGVIAIIIIRTPSYNIQTNGKLYIINKLSKSITVFDLNEGKEITELPMRIEPHEATTLNNQKRVIVTDYGAPNIVGKSISVINTETYKVERTIELDGSSRPHGIISFPDSNKVGVVTDVGNDFLLINLDNGIIEKKIPTQQSFSHLLVLHPQKPLVFVSNVVSGSVSVIDLNISEIIKTIPCGLGTEGIDITPNGAEIWVTNHKENSIYIINTETYEITDKLISGKESLRLKFSIDGKHCLVTNATDGTISIYDRFSKKQIKTIRIPGKKNLIEKVLFSTPRPVGLLMHPNGLYAFVANSNADRIEVIDMKSFEIVSTIGTGRIPDGMTFLN